jgi:hypothetical protein
MEEKNLFDINKKLKNKTIINKKEYKLQNKNRIRLTNPKSQGKIVFKV